MRKCENVFRHEVLPLLGQLQVLQAPVVEKISSVLPLSYDVSVLGILRVSLGRRTLPFRRSILGRFSRNGGDGTNTVEPR